MKSSSDVPSCQTSMGELLSSDSLLYLTDVVLKFFRVFLFIIFLFLSLVSFVAGDVPCMLPVMTIILR